jgi:hypothetical protein
MHSPLAQLPQLSLQTLPHSIPALAQVSPQSCGRWQTCSTLQRCPPLQVHCPPQPSSPHVD